MRLLVKKSIFGQYFGVLMSKFGVFTSKFVMILVFQVKVCDNFGFEGKIWGFQVKVCDSFGFEVII